MTSEIRTNSLKSRAGLSTVTMTDSGPMFSGITTFVDNSGFTFGVGGGTSIFTPATNVLTFGTNNTEKIRIDASGHMHGVGVITATHFYGDGSNLTGISAGTSLTGSTNNTVCTVTGANAITGEANFTFNGSKAIIKHGTTNSVSDRGLMFQASSSLTNGQVLPGITLNPNTNEHRPRAGISGIGHGSSNGTAGMHLIFMTAYRDDGSQLTSSDERLRIDSSGRVLIGTQTQFGDGNDKLMIENGTTGGRLTFGSSAGFAEPIIGQMSAYWADNKKVAAISFFGGGDTTNKDDGTIRFATSSANNIAERLRITSTGYVGINTTSPQYPLHVAGHTTDASPDGIGVLMGLQHNHALIHLNAESDLGCIIDFSTPNTDRRGGILYYHSNNSTVANRDAMQFHTAGSERLRIHSTGQVSISHPNYIADSHDAMLVVKPNITDSSKDSIGILVDGDSGTGGGQSSPSMGIKIVNTNTWNNSTHQYGLYNEVGQQYVASGTGIFNKVSGLYGTTTGYHIELNKNNNAYTNGYGLTMNIKPTGSGGSNYFIYCQKDDTNLKMRVLQNGNLQNANNSYGSTSDVKLKENIVDANSQWDDIKSLRVRNFNFKDDPDKVKMLGVVAQEAEAVSAGLVETDNDIEIDETTGEGKIVGTTKFVKYSILYMKAVKCLQEAQTRIEKLEQENIALRVRVTNLEDN